MQRYTSIRPSPAAIVGCLLAFAATSVFWSPAADAQQHLGTQVSAVDTVTTIREAMLDLKPRFQMSRSESIDQMHYVTGAVNRIEMTVDGRLVIFAHEDPEGAQLYGDIAELAWNSGPVVAGALFLAGTTEDKREHHPAWVAIGEALAGMFGDGIDPALMDRGVYVDVRPIRAAAAKASRELASFNGQTAEFARLKVLGALWSDPVAELAGASGLDQLQVSAADRAAIDAIAAHGLETIKAAEAARVARQPQDSAGQAQPN